MYETLARLAEVNGALLTDDSDEEVLEDLQARILHQRNEAARRTLKVERTAAAARSKSKVTTWNSAQLPRNDSPLRGPILPKPHQSHDETYRLSGN